MKLKSVYLIIAAILLVLSLLTIAELLFAPKLLKSSLAAVHYRAGRHGSAAKIFQDIRAKSPADSVATHNEAKSLYKQGQIDEAANALKAMEAARKGSPDLYYDLGNAAYRQNKYQEAADYYKQAMLLDPGDYNAKANYELALRKLEEQQQQPQAQPQNQPPEPKGQKKDENPDYDNILGALDQRESLDRQQKKQAPGRSPKNWW